MDTVEWLLRKTLLIQTFTVDKTRTGGVQAASSPTAYVCACPMCHATPEAPGTP